MDESARGRRKRSRCVVTRNPGCLSSVTAACIHNLTTNANGRRHICNQRFGVQDYYSPRNFFFSFFFTILYDSCARELIDIVLSSLLHVLSCVPIKENPACMRIDFMHQCTNVTLRPKSACSQTVPQLPVSHFPPQCHELFPPTPHNSPIPLHRGRVVTCENDMKMSQGKDITR